MPAGIARRIAALTITAAAASLAGCGDDPPEQTPATTSAPAATTAGSGSAALEIQPTSPAAGNAPSGSQPSGG